MVLSSPMKALIYTRVSQDRAEGRSPAEQEAEARRLCESNGWEVAAVVSDSVGASRHSKGKRDGWTEAHRLLEAGDVDVLVTWEASRAQRDVAAYAELRDLCARTGTLWSYSGRTHDLTESGDRFRTGLDALLAEREADEISERVQRAIRSNAVHGRPHGRRLFGYRRLYDETTGQLLGQEPHPDEAPVVRRIFGEYLAGGGIHSIAKGLQADGITTGTGARWQDSQVARVLKNPAYAARRVHRGEVIGDADWPPLVDADTWERVQARREDMASRRVRIEPTARLLTGVARCGVCGTRMYVGHDRKQRKVYVCREGFHVARDERKLDDFVTAALLRRLEDPATLEALDVTSPDPAVEGARRELGRLRAQLDDAVGEFTAGNLTASTLGRIEADLLGKIADAERTLRRAVVPLDVDVPASGVDQWWDDELEPEQRREIVAAFVASVTVHPTRRGSRTFDPSAVDVEWRA